MKISGIYKLQHMRNGELLAEIESPNLVTEEGRNYLLNASLRSGPVSSNWFIGFIDDVGFTQVAVSDTHVSHPGWVETSPYSQATRVSWSPDNAAGGDITNTTPVDFTINAAAAIKGIFISSISTKGSTGSGVLLNATLLPLVRNVSNGDQIRVTYRLETS